MHLAVIAGAKRNVAALLDHGAAVDSSDDEGYTPLHRAVRGGGLWFLWFAFGLRFVCDVAPEGAAITQQLLERKASPNAVNSNGRTALHLAARFCEPEVTR